MQIAEAAFRINISDVAHPQGVWMHRDIVLYQILVFVESVIGVCRVPRLWTLQYKTECTQNGEEGIAAGNPAVGIYTVYHEPQLVASYARIHLTDVPDSVYYWCQAVDMAVIIAFLLVVSLSRAAK